MDSPGENVLAEFSSLVDAVQCVQYLVMKKEIILIFKQANACQIRHSQFTNDDIN